MAFSLERAKQTVEDGSWVALTAIYKFAKLVSEQLPKYVTTNSKSVGD